MNSLTLKSALYPILISLIPFSVFLLPIQKASAQITPDSTFATESSVVNQLNQLKSLIEGGALRGENLFHSFLEFNVGNGQSVYFVNPDGVNNILTRVTGNNISQILGTLGVNGNANLFLINPNGFMFGNGAKLDLNGSFTATTGDIQLGENGVFSATDIERSSLLSVKPEAVFANIQGQIENRASLLVRDGEKIILMADKVLNTGNLTASGGMIKVQGNEVNISGNSLIDVSGNEEAGAIALQGTEQVNIGENVSLRADALLSGDGGLIEITSQDKVQFFGKISAKGDNPGTVIIDAPTVINNGVIDLSAENSEGEKASEEGTEEEKAIASNTESEKTIASEPENGSAMASDTESGKAIASNFAPESEKTIASQEQSQILAVNNPRLQADESLGKENTEIEAIDENNDRVVGGAERGVNLFHSFLEFNIETSKGVYFANPIGIENILARVTGDNTSGIRGTLGVLGNANLFFLNPNGILFGPNASLDLNSSLLATTADSIIFPNGDQFSATNPEIPPLLTANLEQPMGLQFGENPGQIIVQGTGNNLRFDPFTFRILREERPVGLKVPKGKTIALVGGNVILEGGNLTAPEGQIELASLEGGELARLMLTNKGWKFSYDDVRNFQDIYLAQSASVDTSGEGAGNIQIQGRVIKITDGSAIVANTLGSQSGGDFMIKASESVELTGISANGQFNSSLFSTTEDRGNAGELKIFTKKLLIEGGATIDTGTAVDSEGNGGNLTINATESVQLTGESEDGRFGSILAARTQGMGEGGELTINTKHLSIEGGAQVDVSTTDSGNGGILKINASESVQVIGTSDKLPFSSALAAQAQGTGDGGELKIHTRRLIVKDGGQIGTGTFGAGNAGDLLVNATESVELQGTSKDGRVPSGLFTSTHLGAGEAGDLLLHTSKLIIKNGGQIGTGTFGAGNAGDLLVNATESVELEGTSNDGEFGSSLFVDTLGTGDAGNLIINTGKLLIQDASQVRANTLGSGNGGNLTINASELVQIIGVSEDGLSSSGLFARTKGTGSAGELTINTPKLLIQEGGRISTETFTSGKAGNITLTLSESLFISDSGSGLFANTEVNSTGNGGNITVNSPLVNLENNGAIAVNSKGKGQGGNIKISTNLLNLDNSDITAETLSTKGGEITLSIEELLTLQNGSGITATAGTAQAGGDGGNIEINSPFILSIPSNPFNTITANAFEGNGGNIEITTNAIFGGEFLIIDASSQFGLDGEVIINDPDVNPTSGLSNLPQNTVKVEVAQGCQTIGGRSTLEFFVIGRGGLPPTPDDLFSSEIVIADWIPLDLADEKVQEQTLEGSFTEEITNLTLLTNLSCPRN